MPRHRAQINLVNYEDNVQGNLRLSPPPQKKEQNELHNP